MQHLHHLSPLNVLQRGYALAYNAEGKTLARSDAVQPGDKISVPPRQRPPALHRQSSQ